MTAQMTTLPNGLRLRLNYCPDLYTRSGKVKASYTKSASELRAFRKAEVVLLKEKPHLAKHKPCGLCPDTDDRPTRRVVMPNGHVIHSTWYKVPTTDADARRAWREAMWMNSKDGRDYYRAAFA